MWRPAPSRLRCHALPDPLGVILDYFLVLVLAILAGGWSVAAGIQFGLNPWGVYIAAVVGSLAFSTVVLVVGGHARDRVVERLFPGAKERVEEGKAAELLDRWGLPGFATLGAAVLGPTVTLSAALIMGLDRRRFAMWYYIGTIVSFGLLTWFWTIVT